MFNFDGKDVQRVGGAAIGALFLTVTMVGAAVAPGHAAPAQQPFAVAAPMSPAHA